MGKGQNGRCAKAHVLEAEPDVDQHQDQGNDDRADAVVLHLIRDRCGDRLRRDVVLGYAELILQILVQGLPLVHGEGSCLEDDGVAAGDLLHLNIGITGDTLKDRDNLLIQLIQGVALVKGDGRGRASHEVQAVVQGTDPAVGIDAHDRPAEDDGADGDSKEDPAVLHKVHGLFLLSHAVPLLVLCEQVVEAVHVPLGDKQGREHRENNTDGQGLGKALDGAGSQNAQDYRCNQRGHVAVDDGRECLAVAGVNSLAHAFSVSKLLTDSRKDDDVRIDSHTDGEEDAGDARER